MMCSMVSNFIYVIVFANLVLMNESKTMKRYKRRNEDLLNNLNSTFATLMNIMMVDPNDNAQFSREITKEFSKEQFYNGDTMQSNDYQDLLGNNSVYNQQLTSYENGYNNNQISGRSFEQSPSLTNYFNSQSPKSNLGNSYGNQIIQHQNGYISPEQLANAPTYMDNNPSLNQIEINQNENLPASSLIVDDNFSQLTSNQPLDNTNPSKTSSYLSNYSDMSKYGKIKVSDFGSTEPTILKNKHFYELINDDNSLTINDFKKKPMSVSSNSIPLKFLDDKKNTYGSFRSFSPEFDSEFDQFRITANTPKLETTSNYFDKVNTKDPIQISKTTTTTFETQPNFNNKNYNNPSNSLSSSLSNSYSNNFPNNYNNLANQVTGEQRITPNTGTSLPTNKLMNHNLGYMVSNNNEQQFPVGITNSHLRLPLVMPYNQNTPVEISAQIPTQKGGYSSFANYGHGGSSYGSLGHMGGSSYGGHGGYSMPMQSYSSGHYSMPSYSSHGSYGGSYSMPSKGYGGGYSSYGHGGYSMPMHSYSTSHYSMPMHSVGYEQIPMAYNVKANVNAKITPSISHGTHSAIMSYGGGGHGSYGGGGHGSYGGYGHGGSYGLASYGGHGSYGGYKNLPQSTTTSVKHV